MRKFDGGWRGEEKNGGQKGKGKEGIEERRKNKRKMR